MPAPGMTTDLYVEGADGKPVPLEIPPSAPTDVPAPTKPAQPIMVKERRMADEKADGSIRDTSTEALRPGNDLGFRNLSDEETPKPKEEAAPEPPKEALKPVPEAAPVPEKLYAGKFKSDSDLEKSYLELEKKLTETSQKAAQLEREKLATPPPAPAPKTPEQLATEEAEAGRILREFTTDPKGFLEKRDQRIQQTTMVALSAQQIAENWRKANPDLAEHEIRVAFEANLLAQADPEIAKDPARLLQTATDKFRQFTGKIRSEGAKEALTQETRTIPLLTPSSTTPATEQPAKAPLTQDEAFELHLKMLKKEEQRSHRGLRR